MSPAAVIRSAICRDCKEPREDGRFMARGRCNPCYQKAVKRGDIVVASHSELRDSHEDTPGERCRCGLRLPCNDCVPRTILGMMERMREHGQQPSNWPEPT